MADTGFQGKTPSPKFPQIACSKCACSPSSDVLPNTHQAPIQRACTACSNERDEFLQRKKKNRKPQAVIITMSSDLEKNEPALISRAKVYRVDSLDGLKGTLQSIDFPITTLLLNAHGSNGAVEVGDTWHNAMTLASEISGLLASKSAPSTVDLRACNLGRNPGGMDAIRAALGASRVQGGTCFIIQAPLEPMVFDVLDSAGVPSGEGTITSESQLNEDPSLRTYFEENFADHLAAFKEPRPAGQTTPCIVNGDGTVEGAKKAYFEGHGYLMEAYFSPDGSGAWDPARSSCYGATRTLELTAPLGEQLFDFRTGPCQLIAVSVKKSKKPKKPKKPKK